MEQFLKIPPDLATYEAIYRLTMQKECEKVFVPIIEMSIDLLAERLNDETDPQRLNRVQGARAALKEVKRLFDSAYDVALKMRSPRPDLGVY